MKQPGTKRIFIAFLIAGILATAAPVVSGQARLLGKEFIGYCRDIPWEDIFVHTDREKYIAGETIWFSVYSFERQRMKPSRLSRIAYVELLNYDNRPVLHRRIYLEDGAGPGDMNLPDTLSTGIYTMRAYTAWMKNFLPDGAFVKEIGVFNAINANATVRRPLRQSEDAPAGSRQAGGSGFNLGINNLSSELLELTLETSSDFRRHNGDILNLFIQTRGNINISESLPLTGDLTKRLISKKMLMPGVNHLTVFNSTGRVIAEKYIFTPPAAKTSLDLAMPVSAGRREKISLNVLPEDSLYRNLSVAVTPLTTEEYLGLDEFLLFGNEFGNDLLQKVTRLKSLGNTAAIDSLLSVVSSKWINWNKITGLDPVTIKYLPESREHFLSGRLENNTGAGDYAILSIPGKQAYFQYSVTDSAGNFSFGIPVDEDMKELIIQPDDMKGIVNVGSSYAEDYSSPGHAEDTVAPPPWIHDRSVNFQVQKIYGTVLSQTRPVRLPSAQYRRFYGKPDIGLLLSDYIKLPLMEEIFFELLPGTYLKKRKSEYEIYVTDPLTNAPYDYPTTLFVDGVRIDDAGAIAALDPEVVEKIDVIRDRYLVGDYLFHGIVNIITKAGDFSAVQIPEYAIRTYYRVIDPVQDFISPAYTKPEQKNSRIPDFRNTLWWNPSATGEGPLEFWSSDLPGEYRITVNGVAADGSPVSSEKIFRIE